MRKRIFSVIRKNFNRRRFKWWETNPMFCFLSNQDNRSYTPSSKLPATNMLLLLIAMSITTPEKILQECKLCAKTFNNKGLFALHTDFSHTVSHILMPHVHVEAKK